jgi:hypothetical protein
VKGEEVRYRAWIAFKQGVETAVDALRPEFGFVFDFATNWSFVQKKVLSEARVRSRLLSFYDLNNLGGGPLGPALEDYVAGRRPRQGKRRSK